MHCIQSFRSQYFQAKKIHFLHHLKLNLLSKITIILRIHLVNTKVYSLEASCRIQPRSQFPHFKKIIKINKIHNQLITES